MNFQAFFSSMKSQNWRENKFIPNKITDLQIGIFDFDIFIQTPDKFYSLELKIAVEFFFDKQLIAISS